MALPAVAALVGASIIGGLAQAMGSLIGRALLAIGIGFVSYKGLDTLLGWIGTNMISAMSSVPPSLVGWFGVLKIGTSISIIMSAFATRLTLISVGGVVKKAVFK